MRLLLPVLLLVLLFQFTTAEEIKFILISDVHYDPYYGTPKAVHHGGKKRMHPGNDCTKAEDALQHPYGMSNCDSPQLLVNSTLADIKAQYSNSNGLKEGSTYMIFTGDWLRHHMDRLQTANEEAGSIFSFLVDGLASLPHSTIPAPSPFLAGSLGNNDFVPDYIFNYTSDRQELLQHMSRALHNRSLLSDKEAETFGRCAYYSRSIPAASLEVIVLNTVLYSAKMALGPDETPLNPQTHPDPCNQFAFLKKTLNNVRMNNRNNNASKRVIVLSHIPPVLDIYYVLSEGNTSYAFFHPYYQQCLTEILFEYKDVIAFQFYGHTHEMALVADASLGTPGLIIPAISPANGNTPSYIIATYDTEKTVFTDFVWRSFNLNTRTWGTLSPPLTSAVPVESFVSPQALAAQVDQLRTNDTMWELYQIFHSGGNGADLFPHNNNSDSNTNYTLRNMVACSMTASSSQTFVQCVAHHETPETTDNSTNNNVTTSATSDSDSDAKKERMIIAAAIVSVTVLIVIVVAVIFIIRYRRRMMRIKQGEETSDDFTNKNLIEEVHEVE